MRFDWVHTFLQDGMLAVESWLLIDACEAHGIATHQDLHAFLKEPWQFSRRCGNGGKNLWTIFNEHGERSNNMHGAVKCSASELLCLYGLLRHFAEVRLGDATRRATDAARRTTDAGSDDPIAGELLSFMLMCKAVDILLFAKRGALPLSDASTRLRAALKAHMTQHRRVHGDAKIKPKAHWAFDICDSLSCDTWLFDAFVIERLHLRVKKIAQNVKNMEYYEQAVLSGVVNEHLRMLEESSFEDRLIQRALPFPGVPGALIADHLEANGVRLSVSDYVFQGEALGHVQACCLEDGNFFVVVDVLQKLADMSPRSSRWSTRQVERTVWRTSGLSECLAWQLAPPLEIVVVRM
jgi:hypothetical protein